MALTPKQLILLANMIPVREVFKIAEGDLNVDYAKIRNIEYNFAGDAERISQEIFRVWSYTDVSVNQKQVSAEFKVCQRFRKCSESLKFRLCSHALSSEYFYRWSS